MADGWIIDVCCTCGRIARWPFCEHRPIGYVPDQAAPWCTAIVVAPTTKRGRELAACQRQQASE